MRNSISVALVIIAISLAFATTMANGITEAHAAGFVVASGQGFGLLIALILGLLGCALKPNVVKADVAAIEADMAIEAAFKQAAQELKAERIQAELDLREVLRVTAETDRMVAQPRNLGEIEASLRLRSIDTFLPAIGESLKARRNNATNAWLPPSLGLKASVIC